MDRMSLPAGARSTLGGFAEFRHVRLPRTLTQRTLPRSTAVVVREHAADPRRRRDGIGALPDALAIQVFPAPRMPRSAL
jgi:hypothetical protein